jgi:hypothetical protein
VDSQCSIIAFAHLGGGKLDVLQVIEGKIFWNEKWKVKNEKSAFP